MDIYKNEARCRFGGTDAYKEFESKTADYTDENHKCAEACLNTVFVKFAECNADSNTPDSFKAQALVKELQDLITENFYTCTNEILKGLGAMYVADERFKENIDKSAIGTAEFVSRAIESYCK